MDDAALTAELSRLFTAAVGNGMDEIVIRVGRYGLTPSDPDVATDYQAIARFRNRTIPWVVAVGPSHGAAFLEALRGAAPQVAATPPDTTPSPAPVPRARTRTRMPPA